MKRKEILQILSVTDEPMELYKVSNEYELEYMIPDIERIIRQSREYRGYVFWKKSNHKQSICSELKIDSYEYDNITLEMHHHPLNLFQIVYIIGMKMLSELKDEDSYYTTFQIASEVIEEHFEDNIGIVPLTKTYHQLYHNGLYQIKEESISGDYLNFKEKYKEFIPKNFE